MSAVHVQKGFESKFFGLRMSRRARRLCVVAAVTFLVVGFPAIWIHVGGWIPGGRIYPVVGNSMYPMIPWGSRVVVIYCGPTDLGVGDLIVAQVRMRDDDGCPQGEGNVVKEVTGTSPLTIGSVGPGDRYDNPDIIRVIGRVRAIIPWWKIVRPPQGVAQTPYKPKLGDPKKLVEANISAMERIRQTNERVLEIPLLEPAVADRPEVIDGDLTTGTPPSDWFEIDMGKECTLEGLRFLVVTTKPAKLAWRVTSDHKVWNPPLPMGEYVEGGWSTYEAKPTIVGRFLQVRLDAEPFGTPGKTSLMEVEIRGINKAPADN